MQSELGQDAQHGPTDQITKPKDRGSEDRLGEHEMGRGCREKKMSSHLEDYVCYSTNSHDPSSTCSFQEVSSGKPYPLADYVTCDNFSPAHKAYLAAITKIMEPCYFHQAVTDPKW